MYVFVFLSLTNNDAVIVATILSDQSVGSTTQIFGKKTHENTGRVDQVDKILSTDALGEVNRVRGDACDMIMECEKDQAQSMFGQVA